MSLRFGDCQRQPGEAGARADIENLRASQVRAHGEAVLDVHRDHLGAIPDRGQVDLFVPALELVEQKIQFVPVIGHRCRSMSWRATVAHRC